MGQGELPPYPTPLARADGPSGRGANWLTTGLELARWAAKEAAYKALYPRVQATWKDLSLVRGASGLKPELVWEGDRAQGQGITMHCSLSHDADLVMAYVIVEHDGRYALEGSCRAELRAGPTLTLARRVRFAGRVAPTTASAQARLHLRRKTVRMTMTFLPG